MKYFVFFILFSFAITLTAQNTNRLVVNFDFDKYSLTEKAIQKLDASIQKDSIDKIEITAHCDSFGSDAYNDALALKRAEEIKNYFISKNSKINSVEIFSKGKRFPLNNNENASARALNRRAEIVITFLENRKIAEPVSVAKTEEKKKQKQNIQTDSSTILNGTDTSGINLENVEVGTSIRLGNLNFYGGRHDLLPKSSKTLEQLLNTLKANPNLEIQIQGHVCCIEFGDGVDIGTGTNNLSVNRAKTVYDYLVKNGIDPKRLSYIGFGSSMKLVDEFSEDDRTTNRRVEIKIVSK